MKIEFILSCPGIIMLLVISSCFEKKEMKVNLESWLDKNFPGQYEVLSNARDLQPRHFIEKKMTSIVADKKDPEVQCVFDWHKDTSDLGLTVILIRDAFETSRKETAQSRVIFQALLKNRGTNTSVSVVENAAYFLVYAEPTFENRKAHLQQILATLDQQTNHEQTSIWIEFMEDSVYQKIFKDIIPKGYWHRLDNYHQRNKTVSLDFEWSPELDLNELMKHWTVNTESDRLIIDMANAYHIALKWAEKNISAPFYLEPVQMVQYEIDEEDPMAIHFHFPYFPSKPPEESDNFEIKGYVTGIYQIDMKTFLKIKTVKEL